MLANTIRFSRENKKIFALIAATTALCMMLLDTAAFSVVLPTMEVHFSLTPYQARWLLTGYFLSSAALVLVGGRLADIFGTRRIFIFGSISFALSNLLIGCSPFYYSILIARILQGMSLALMGPSGFRTIVDEFSIKERGSAIGITAGISSIFLVIGPFLSGILTEFYSWRAVFFIYLPISMIGCFSAHIGISEHQRKEEKIDLIALLLVSLSIFSAVFGLMDFGVTFKFSVEAKGSLIVSFCSFILLYLRSRNQENPFFNFHLFKNHQFCAGLLVAILTAFIMLNPYFWSLFLQRSLFLQPVEAAAYMVIAAMPTIVIAPASGLLADKQGVQVPIFLGFFCILIFVFAMILFCLYHSVSLMILAFFCYGCGTALILTPLSTMTMSQVPENLRGFASGAYTTTRLLGSSLGVPLLGGVFHHSRANSFSHLMEHQFGGQIYSLKQISSIITTNASDVSAQTMSTLKLIYTNSSFAGLSAINVCNGFITIIALVLTLVYIKDYIPNMPK